MKQLLLFPECVPAGPDSPLLSSEEQKEVLRGLLLGGSPQVICGRLGVGADVFSRTLAEDAEFRARLRAVRELMTQNVVATLYAAAIKGTASAQTLWLKTFPPAGAGDTCQEEMSNAGAEWLDEGDCKGLDERDLREWFSLQGFADLVGR